MNWRSSLSGDAGLRPSQGSGGRRVSLIKDCAAANQSRFQSSLLIVLSSVELDSSQNTFTRFRSLWFSLNFVMFDSYLTYFISFCCLTFVSVLAESLIWLIKQLMSWFIICWVKAFNFITVMFLFHSVQFNPQIYICWLNSVHFGLLHKVWF